MTTDSTFDFSRMAAGSTKTRRYGADERLFIEGDAGDQLFIVRSGRIAIKSAGAIVENIGPGGILGEMALIDGSPRSATAIAAEPSEVAVIDRAAFLSLVRNDGDFALLLMRLLAHRLRRANASV
ncbi:MAG: cyclic nucleotide-binding domain-containing protein [Hyphomicrobiaceae bacterium]|nr:cyclic nucleotide-binding domain-containing protein [Hyphomicrobiaceae bacterium]